MDPPAADDVTVSVVSCWMPREPEVAARSAALLMTTAAVALAVFVVLEPSTGAPVEPVASLSVVAVLFIASLGLWRLGTTTLGRFDVGMFMPIGSVTCVAFLNGITADTSAAAQVFFCFPVLWAASQLQRRAAGFVCGYAVVSNGLLVLALEPAGIAIPDVAFVSVVLISMTLLIGRAGDRQEELVTALRRQADRDPLTGLSTRPVLDAALMEAMATCAQGTALVLIDVDRFKLINDAHGHPVGDAALVHLGEVLATQVRAADALIGRLGGDELGVLLPDCPITVAVDRAEAMVTAVRNTPLVLPGGDPLPLSISVGVAHAQVMSASLEDLYVTADAALYDAKRRGRDQVSVAYADGRS